MEFYEIRPEGRRKANARPYTLVYFYTRVMNKTRRNCVLGQQGTMENALPYFALQAILVTTAFCPTWNLP